MPDHDAAFRTADRFRERADLDAIADDLHTVCRDFGLIGFCLVRLHGSGLADDIKPLVRGWPADWLTRYAGEEHARRDPVLVLTRSTLRTFTWAEAFRECPLPGSDLVYAEAASYGLTSGFVVPVHGPGGRQGLISFATNGVDLGPADALVLHVVALQAYAQVCDIITALRRSEASERLTPREIDCLRWAADGKTSWEIAQILTISQHTTDWYLTSAARKLKAASRVQAVAEAFRRGIID